MKQTAKQIAKEISANLLEKLTEASKSWEGEGKDAFSSLKRLGANNLPEGDEVIIAKRLFVEVQSLKKSLKAKGIGLGEFCSKAELGGKGDYSKELHRMMLAPSKNPNEVKLRKSAAKYRRLIEAIGSHTKESKSTLANRILAGTSLLPKEGWEELEIVQATLQAIVDKVDSEFNLFAQFMETADLKVEHVRRGGECTWPLYDWPLDEPNARDKYEKHQAFWLLPIPAKGTDYSWWPNNFFESGIYTDSEFFFVPHIYIGRLEMFKLPDKDKDTVQYHEAIQAEIIRARNANENDAIPKIRDEWNEAEQRPFGQIDALRLDEFIYDGWIVIYPTPDNQKLMPMLFIPLADGQSYLMPLDVHNLSILRKAVYFGESAVTTVYERIKTLIGHKTSTDVTLIKRLMETAPWFKQNPILKIAHTQTLERENLLSYYHKLVQSI